MTHYYTVFTVYLISSLLLTPDSKADGYLDPNEKLYELCPNEPTAPPLPVIEGEASQEIGTLLIKADEAQAAKNRLSVFRGSVELKRGYQGARADQVTYNMNNEKVEIVGDAELWDKEIYWAGQQGWFNMTTDRGQLFNGKYSMITNRGQGNAEIIKFDSRRDITHLENVSYTTCPGDLPVWKLTANDIKLEHSEDFGRVKHAFLSLWDIPIMYLPYATFPLSDARKTGILPPIIGNTSNSGFQLGLPFYWNIAPEQDATFIPTYLSDRGIMLGAQYRYLLETGRGSAQLEYIPVDRLFNEESRYLFELRHQQTFDDNHGRINIRYGQASDRSYFQDFGSNISQTSRRYIERRADITYGGFAWDLFNWAVLARVQDFQSIDVNIPQDTPDDRLPYRRLPQVIFNARTPPQDWKLNFELNASTTTFDHETTPKVLGKFQAVQGTRLDITPSVSFPIHTVSSYVIPKIGIRHTQYLLEDLTEPPPCPPKNNSTETPTNCTRTEIQDFSSSIGRTLPIFSVDAGLFFEQDFDFADESLLHSLSPRVYYLYIPKKEQDDIPIFDTILYDVSFGRMFREDRFSNPDRVGDANQITLALTSQIIDNETGWEHLRASIGQIYYFADRSVTLVPENEVDKNPNVIDPQREADTSSVSEIVGELATRISDSWFARANVIWDPDAQNHMRKTTLGVRYNPTNETLFNAQYHFRRPRIDPLPNLPKDIIEQTDLSFAWEVNPNWSLVGRWYYDIADNQTLEALGGVMYDSCCWSIQAVGRRFLRIGSDTLASNVSTLEPDQENQNEFDTGFFVQIELKGLGGLGRQTTNYLKRAIPGYGYNYEEDLP